MSQHYDFIIPECYVDTNLVETLLDAWGCNHQKGCNQVAKVMQEKFSDRFAVGIIDADKRKPGYLSEFREIASSEHLTLFRHSYRCHFFILVYPAIDGFILSCSKAGDVDMADYSLSSKMKEFTCQTKNVMSNKDMRFKRLFGDLKDIGEMRLMRTILSYFVNSMYNSLDEEILRLFEA